MGSNPTLSAIKFEQLIVVIDIFTNSPKSNPHLTPHLFLTAPDIPVRAREVVGVAACAENERVCLLSTWRKCYPLNIVSR